jgi:WD40 repeat protein
MQKKYDCKHMSTIYIEDIRDNCWPGLFFSETMFAKAHEHTIELWNMRTQECETILIGHSHEIPILIRSFDHKILASVSYYSTIKLWDTSTRKCIHTLTGHLLGADSLAFSSDDTYLASGSIEICIWDVASGYCYHVIQGNGTTINRLLWTPDGTTLISASNEKILRMWNVSTGQCKKIFPQHDTIVCSCGMFSR